jgi:hypothetical protein
MSVLREFLACRSFFFLPSLQKEVILQLFRDFLPVSSAFDSCLYGTDFRSFADCVHLQTLPDMFTLNLLTFRLMHFVKS